MASRIRVGPKCTHDRIQVICGAEDDYRDRRQSRTQHLSGAEREIIYERHHQVQQDHVWQDAIEQRQSISTVAWVRHVMTSQA